MYTRRGQLSKQIFDAVIYENIPQLKNLINRRGSNQGNTFSPANPSITTEMGSQIC